MACRDTAACLPGLSPRGRGKRHSEAELLKEGGSIPAWAGETEKIADGKAVRTVYPRVGGGNAGVMSARREDEGLSPRGRGKLIRPFPFVRAGGSIPAWAGETTTRKPLRFRPEVYPRVGGGNTTIPNGVANDIGLSPRGRGKRASIRPGSFLYRSIPAWAGETRFSLAAMTLKSVYPRVGGGNPGAGRQRMGARGLSPRGRGKRHSACLGT